MKFNSGEEWIVAGNQDPEVGLPTTVWLNCVFIGLLIFSYIYNPEEFDGKQHSKDLTRNINRKIQINTTTSLDNDRECEILPGIN